MEKSYVILFIILLMIIPASAVSTLGTFRQNTEITLKQNCNCTYVNITSILLPNGSQILMNQNMTKSGTDFYYPYNRTELLGAYVVNGNSDRGVWAFDFYINQGGQNLSTAQGILYFIALLLATGLFVLSLFFSIKIPFKNTINDEGRIVSVNKLKYIKLFLIPVTYVLLLMIVAITRSILANFLYLDGISNIFNWLYWLMMSLILPAIAVTFVLIVVFLFEDNILYKKIKRGNYR